MYYSTAIGGDVAIVTKGGLGHSKFLDPTLLIEMELCLGFPDHNVGVVSRQNSPLHKTSDALELCGFSSTISIYYGRSYEF
jgi:hypothetical protein